jgi:acyl-CoA thioesterase
MKDLIIDAYKISNNFGNDLGMVLCSANKEGAHYQIVITEKHLATPVAAHGGVIASLMDGTLGVAALAHAIERNHVVSTIEFKINFTAPVYVGDVLDARAEVIHSGKRILVCEGKIVNQNGDLVAKGTGTFNAYPAEKAKLF